MDVLTDVLNVIKLRGSLYFRTVFRPPWGVRVPMFGNVARFHLVTRGQCWVRVTTDGPPTLLRSGDLVMIPHGAEHRLSDAPDRDCLAVDRVVEAAGFTGEGALVYGGDDGEDPTCLVCGHFAFEPQQGELLLRSLPPIIHVKQSESPDYGWLDDAMKFITYEVFGNQPGYDAIVNRLSEILFIQTIRVFVAKSSQQGLLAAIRDKALGRALKAVHGAPERSWTVESMAREAGLSRTLFAERMRSTLGIPPMQYLTYWRMELARRKLGEQKRSVSRVADEVGYQSLSAFTRAFQRQFGYGPGKYQREL